MGKTTVALDLARRAADQMPVWWVTAASPTALAAGMRLVAATLGASADQLDRAWGDTAIAAANLLWTMLDGRHGPWLLDQLAWTLHAVGRDDEAEPELLTVLDARLRILGDEHPDTLVTRMDLAEVWHAQGRQQQAETGYRTVLEARRRILGEDHPKVLNTRADLARLWHEQGRLEDAEAEYHAVVTARRRILGEDHPNTLTSRHNLASVLSQQGRRQRAEAEYRAVLDARCRVLG